MDITVRQLKAARALLAWSQENLSANSGVSYPTIARLEKEDGVLRGRAETVAKIIGALEAAGIEFSNGVQPGVRMKRTVEFEENIKSPRGLGDAEAG